MKLFVLMCIFLTACVPQGRDSFDSPTSPSNTQSNIDVKSPSSENEDYWNEGDYYMYVNKLNIKVNVEYLDYTPADDFDSGRVVGSLEPAECLLFNKNASNLISFNSVKSFFCRGDCRSLMGCRICPNIPGHYNIIESSQAWESNFEARKESLPSHSECKNLRAMLQ